MVVLSLVMYNFLFLWAYTEVSLFTGDHFGNSETCYICNLVQNVDFFFIILSNFYFKTTWHKAIYQSSTIGVKTEGTTVN